MTVKDIKYVILSNWDAIIEAFRIDPSKNYRMRVHIYLTFCPEIYIHNEEGQLVASSDYTDIIPKLAALKVEGIHLLNIRAGLNGLPKRLEIIKLKRPTFHELAEMVNDRR